MKPNKLIFISHNSHRAGAQLSLLILLEWLKSNTDLSFCILTKGMGELTDRFVKIAPTYIYIPYLDHLTNFKKHLFRNWFPVLKVNQHHKYRRSYINPNDFRLIYSNTIMNGDLLFYLANSSNHVITHVRELDYWMKKSGTKNIELVKKNTDYFIAVSNAVRDNLIMNYGISEDLIEVIYNFLSKSEFIENIGIGNTIRNRLNIPLNAILIGGSGFETWRKGVDLFIQIAKIVNGQLDEIPIFFLWIGDFDSEDQKNKIFFDINQMGLKQAILFTGRVSNPHDYFDALDIFLITSRDDPFPRVCLEAATHKVPTICFDHSGGAPEFVESDAGFIAPYLDVHTMAEHVIRLVKDENLRRKMGLRASQKVQQRHDIDVAAPKIEQVIRRFL